MNNSFAKRIALTGVMAAVVFVFLYVETAFFKLFLPITPAILSIPLAISISLFGDFKQSFVGGTILGVCSFILAFVLGFPFFYNPLISILPRTIMGVIAYFVFKGMTAVIGKTRLNDKVKLVISSSVAGAVGVLVNTVLVLSALWAFGAYSGLIDVLAAILTFNTLFEFIGAIVLVPIFVTAFRAIERRI